LTGAADHARPGPGDSVIDLRAGLAGGEVILFSLNSSRYGSLAAQVGTLAIQDLISVSGERLDARAGTAPATVAIDEFSALGSDHVLALLSRGRESGFSVLVATQELSDLERAGRGFRDQVLGLTTVKIAHRQDVPSSAQTIAEMAGTKLAWDETRQLRGPLDFSGRGGTRRQVERFRIHPNVIKTLGPGEAVLLVKSPAVQVTPLRVLRPAGGGVATTGPRRSPAPARPAPAGWATASARSATGSPGAARTATSGDRAAPEPRSRPALPRPASTRPASTRSSPGPTPGSRGGPGRDDQAAPGVTR
jgi:hypothetical protein